jgi:hypothetical protein
MWDQNQAVREAIMICEAREWIVNGESISRVLGENTVIVAGGCRFRVAPEDELRLGPWKNTRVVDGLVWDVEEM